MSCGSLSVRGKGDHQSSPVGQARRLIGHGLRRVCLHGATALIAVDPTDLGEQQPQVVGHFGGRPHRRTTGSRGGCSRHGDGGRKSVDPIGRRLLELIEKLSGVRREALDVPALPFRIERVQSQAGLAAAADPADHDQLAVWEIQVDVFQVVYANSPKFDVSHSHATPLPADAQSQAEPAIIAGAARAASTSRAAQLTWVGRSRRVCPHADLHAGQCKRPLRQPRLVIELAITAHSDDECGWNRIRCACGSRSRASRRQLGIAGHR